jgi:hypothetical protein
VKDNESILFIQNFVQAHSQFLWVDDMDQIQYPRKLEKELRK